MNIGWSEHGIGPKRKVLYRNFHTVSGVVYLIEISRSPKKVFILLFPNFEQPAEYLQEVLPEKVALKLMNDCANLFENLIANFYVKFGRLQIKEYHGKSTRTVPPHAKREIETLIDPTQSSIVRDHAYNREIDLETPDLVPQLNLKIISLEAKPEQ